MTEFPLVPLSEVALVIAGQHVPAHLYNTSGTGVPYLTGPADFGETRPMVSKWTEHPAPFSCAFDVLVTVKGAGVGKVNLGADAAIGRQLMAIRPSPSLLDQTFLFRFLQAREAQLRRLGQGATVPGIAKGEIERFRVPLPPLPEQRRIAAILDKADAIRRKRQQAIQLTDDLLRSAFLDMFGDPVTNPRRWRVVKLGSVLASKPRIGTTRPAAGGAGHLVVRVGEVGGFEVNLDRSMTADLPPHEIQRHRLLEGDFLLVRAIGSEDHLGKASVFQGSAEGVVFDSHVMRLKLDRRYLLPIFLWQWLKTPGGRLRMMRRARETAVQFNINGSQVAEIDIPLPPIQSQERFCSLFLAVRRSRRRSSDAAEAGDCVFGSLVQLAFRGGL